MTAKAATRKFVEERMTGEMDAGQIIRAVKCCRFTYRITAPAIANAIQIFRGRLLGFRCVNTGRNGGRKFFYHKLAR